MGWQKASGYNWRALVEADIGRWKRVIGDTLRSQTDAPQATAEATTVPNGPTVVMDTSMGRITCQFYEKQAPKAVASKPAARASKAR